jgi:hypothetical protein
VTDGTKSTATISAIMAIAETARVTDTPITAADLRGTLPDKEKAKIPLLQWSDPRRVHRENLPFCHNEVIAFVNVNVNGAVLHFERACSRQLSRNSARSPRQLWFKLLSLSGCLGLMTSPSS